MLHGCKNSYDPPIFFHFVAHIWQGLLHQRAPLYGVQCCWWCAPLSKNLSHNLWSFASLFICLSERQNNCDDADHSERHLLCERQHNCDDTDHSHRHLLCKSQYSCGGTFLCERPYNCGDTDLSHRHLLCERPYNCGDNESTWHAFGTTPDALSTVESLRTVDNMEQLLANTASPLDPQSETGTLATHSEKKSLGCRAKKWFPSKTTDDPTVYISMYLSPYLSIHQTWCNQLPCILQHIHAWLTTSQAHNLHRTHLLSLLLSQHVMQVQLPLRKVYRQSNASGTWIELNFDRSLINCGDQSLWPYLTLCSLTLQESNFKHHKVTWWSYHGQKRLSPWRPWLRLISKWRCVLVISPPSNFWSPSQAFPSSCWGSVTTFSKPLTVWLSWYSWGWNQDLCQNLISVVSMNRINFRGDTWISIHSCA